MAKEHIIITVAERQLRLREPRAMGLHDRHRRWSTSCDLTVLTRSFR